jgi:signal transduction histidine kinase
MGSMIKLLDKPLKVFTTYALIILVGSIPAYYLVIDYIWKGELDERNQIIKTEIQNQLNESGYSNSELNLLLQSWNKIRPEAQINRVNFSEVEPDQTSEIKINILINGELDLERFRVLSTYLKVNDSYFQLTIKTNVESADETMLSIAMVTLLFFIFLVVGFIILNKRISIKLWEPFRSTLDQLKSFDLSDERMIEFNEADILEFDELNQTLRKLVEKNISVYSQQKNFIENASHELQTPIAIIKSKLDVLYQNSKLTTEQSKILDAIQLPLGRLTRINKNLLLLAKLDHSNFPDIENVNFYKLTEESTALFEDYMNAKKLSIEFLGIKSTTFTCSKFLAETLIQNLLSNAIKYCLSHSNILIIINEDHFRIENDGAKALNTAVLFERFTIVSTEAVSSGLGLSIVKQICTKYNWLPTYEFINNKHVFTISFNKL